MASPSTISLIPYKGFFLQDIDDVRTCVVLPFPNRSLPPRSVIHIQRDPSKTIRRPGNNTPAIRSDVATATDVSSLDVPTQRDKQQNRSTTSAPPPPESTRRGSVSSSSAAKPPSSSSFMGVKAIRAMLLTRRITQLDQLLRTLEKNKTQRNDLYDAVTALDTTSFAYGDDGFFDLILDKLVEWIRFADMLEHEKLVACALRILEHSHITDVSLMNMIVNVVPSHNCKCFIHQCGTSC
jgi:hypothetical protein